MMTEINVLSFLPVNGILHISTITHIFLIVVIGWFQEIKYITEEDEAKKKKKCVLNRQRK